MRIEFNAQKRTLQGTGASRRLRHSGRVPGILYGGEQTPEAIEFDHNEIFHKLKQETFHASVLTMLMDGKSQMVLLRDVQMHPFRRQVLHLDFQRVDATHKITTRVPLHFINAELSPGVKLQGGIVSHVMNELEVRCLPGDLPEFIEVDLKDASTGQSVHLSALTLPKGVEAVVAHKGEDPVIAAITVPRSAVAEEAVVATEQAAAAPAAAPAAEKK